MSGKVHSQSKNEKTSRALCRKRLYCNETLSALDDDASPTVSHQNQMETLPTQTVFRITGSQITAQSAPSTGIRNSKDKGSTESRNGGIASSPSCKSTQQNYKKGKYVNGLLSELTRSHNPLHDTLKDSEKNTNSLNKDEYVVTSSRNDEQEVPDITLEEEDTNIDDREDVLVIHDDFLTSSGIDSDSSSDIDWSSLTPPAPRSPSDQRVPELEDEKNFSLGHNELTMQRPAMTPLDSLFGLSMSEFDHQPYYDSTHFQRRSISSDHVVPEFSG